MENFPTRYEDNKTIWVGDIESWMDEAYLSRMFGAICPVVNVKLVRDWQHGGRPVGYGFVQLAGHGDAERLLGQLRGGEPLTAADGRRFKVNWATRGLGSGAASGGASIYVGNLDQSVLETQLLELFAKRYESVCGAKVITEASGASKGYGFVQFQNPADAEMALSAMQGVYCANKPIKVRPSVKPAPGDAGLHQPAEGGVWEPSPPPPPAAATGHPVLVSGLGAGLEEAPLHQYFAAFGAVHRTQVLGERGCGVVTFRDRASAESAVQYLNGYSNGYSDLQARHIDGGECGHAAGGQPPAITNLTTAHAQGVLLTQLRAQEGAAARPPCPLPTLGLEHFHALLRSPEFVRAFEAQVSRNDSGSTMPGGRGSLPWLLQDRPELFEGVLSVQRMNEDFIPALGSPGCSGQAVPSLPPALHVLV